MSPTDRVQVHRRALRDEAPWPPAAFATIDTAVKIMALLLPWLLGLAGVCILVPLGTVLTRPERARWRKLAAGESARRRNLTLLSKWHAEWQRATAGRAAASRA
jgi:hypothetical protein